MPVRPRANAITDYLDLWLALQVYHNGTDTERQLRLRGYLRIKANTIRPLRARQHLRRFIEREALRYPPE